ncbi:MAG: SDR family NAD(P)-dependent oxidoreductase [Lacipirellulaceae bacterium]
MRPLAGKTALVTGAARGIGRALAIELAGRGVRLALSDIEPQGLAATAREALRLSGEACEYVVDSASSDELGGLASRVLDRWAGVDLLVNNAGVTYHGATHTMPAEEWRRLLAVNLHSHLELTRLLLPSLLARPEAHVLNVCSVLGLSGMPRVAAYTATKFAMVGFSESLRAEYGRIGLGVTALCPGFVDTGLFAAARPERHDGQPKKPPKWLCVSPERVARRALRAIERNEALAVLDPVGGWIHGAKRLLPTLFDAALSIGRSRRVAKKRRDLAALSPDELTALRLRLGLVDGPGADLRAA